MRRVLRQADGGRAQTSLSWLADTLLSQHRTARIKFCRPTRRPRVLAEVILIGVEDAISKLVQGQDFEAQAVGYS